MGLLNSGVLVSNKFYLIQKLDHKNGEERCTVWDLVERVEVDAVKLADLHLCECCKVSLLIVNHCRHVTRLFD